MPTNEERREVAARLREFAADCKDEACDSMHFAMYACWSDKGVCEAYNTSEALNRLADLIEPEPERTCSPVEPFDSKTKHIVERGLNHYYWPYKGCPECQCDFPQGSNYCPNCGAKVMGE